MGTVALRHKHVQLDQGKLDRANRALGARTETETIDRALDRIIADLPSQPGMRQLSISLGLGETFMAPAEVATEHTKFLHLAAAGVNVFVSSGDAGSNPDEFFAELARLRPGTVR